MLKLHGNRFINLVVEEIGEIEPIISDITKSNDKILNYKFHIKNKTGKNVLIHDICKYDEVNDLFYVTIMELHD